MTGGRVAVVGGSGALGRAVLLHFRAAGWTTICIDKVASNVAHDFVDAAHAPTTDFVEPLDCVIHTAGAWAGDNIAHEDIMEVSEAMHKANTVSAILAGHVASRSLRNDSKGVLMFTGAAAALSPCPEMLSYYLSKSAVHNLTKAIALQSTTMRVAALLPNVIDTPANRSAMADADMSSWTPPEHLAEFYYQFAKHPDSISHGGLYTAVTQDSETTYHLQDSDGEPHLQE